MPRLDPFPQDGRIPKGDKLRRVVSNLLQDGAAAVIALTDVYTGTHDFLDSDDAKAKMRAWYGLNRDFSRTRLSTILKRGSFPTGQRSKS